ncbi:hypothetical protein GCM10023328_02240 [Modestobacter marinus]|uniref:Lipoprotein n=1 Tax=Modestobacter marinus TaxID=477641 RepID=A0A846LYE8_9ACTN|nr:hypothetical protein [Modestobacter marinus]NIH67350.1 hypothetical protein [Modestobacter marinus]GGL54155.1 hypothetical protein GCM10011589_07720 [Modestobacter marinus]
MRTLRALVPALLLVGCAAGGPPPAAAPSLPAVPGIEGEALRFRSDEAIGGQVQVHLTNTGTAPFTVTGVALDSPGFASLPARPVDAEYAPGQTIDLPTPYGSVDCAVLPDPAAARLTVVRPGGAVEEVQVPLAGGTLAQVHAEECAAVAVAEVVDVAVDGLAPAGDEVTGFLQLTRRSGDEPVAIAALGRSVVLEPVLDAELPATLGPGETGCACRWPSARPPAPRMCWPRPSSRSSSRSG